jgi:rhamnulose-1-phosphate aldolase
VEPRRVFPLVESFTLPVPAVELGGGGILVTGSGRRLRDIQIDPTVNLGFVRIHQNGRTGRLYTAPGCLFERVTSEFSSHIPIHCDQVKTTKTNFHAVIHAQPPYLTYLSHIDQYQDQRYFNEHLFRWQPDTILQLPEGVGVLPFLVSGSEERMNATRKALSIYKLVVWSKQGVMARSDVSVKRASDRIEYAETSARYEYLNLINGERAKGLTPEEINIICTAAGIQQMIYN